MAVFFRIDNSGHPLIAFGTEAKLARFSLPVYEVTGTEEDPELRATRILSPHCLKFCPYIDYSRQMERTRAEGVAEYGLIPAPLAENSD